MIRRGAPSGRVALVVAAACAGAAGLGLEVLLIETSGLVLGYGRAAALGLAVYLAGWALGAGAAAWLRGASARAILALGVAQIVGGPAAVLLFLRLARSAPTEVWSATLVIVGIAAVAALQGLFLPLFARRFDRGVGAMLGASWLGAALGAYGFADRVVGWAGRPWAALVCGVAALAAAAIAALSSRGDALPEPLAGAPSLSLRRAGFIVGCATAAMASFEWIGLRLGVLWLGGMQPALRAILCASLVALGLGAALASVRRRPSRTALALLLGACALAAAWPALHPFVARALGEERAPTLVRGLLLVGPMLLPLGAVVPWLHGMTAGASEGAPPVERGARLARLFVHEAWGAWLGIPLVQWWIVPRFGLPGACAAAVIFVLAALAALVPRARIAASASAALAIGVAIGWMFQPSPALASPPLANPALSVRAFEEDRDFAVAAVDDVVLGERTLFTDGFRAAGTGRDYRYMRALGHLPVLLHARPERVAVLALGTGTTVGAVALHGEVREIDVLEISAAVVRMAPHFEEQNRGVLAAAEDARVRVLLGDGRATLAAGDARYDVLTMEPLLPDSPFAVYLYTREFYAIARGALRDGGLVCQWVPPHALAPPTFVAVIQAFAGAFPWTGIFVSGTQVILIGGETEPALDPSRFRADGDLASELHALGLASPEEVVACFARDGAAFRDPSTVGRALTDADPWIVFAPRTEGAARLADLPRNLAMLRRAIGGPSQRWLDAVGPSARDRASAGAVVRGAREAHAWSEAILRGCAPTSADAKDLDTLNRALAESQKLLATSADARELAAEVEFLARLREGVAELAADGSQTSARIAIAPLERARSLRPERGDTRLYLAVAYDRAGDPRATALFDEIARDCPGIAGTPEGARALALGLSPERWRTLRAHRDRSRERTP